MLERNPGEAVELPRMAQREMMALLSESFRLYDLRRSCATHLLTANEHPKVVSERLGHANIILTLDTYSHVLPSMQQAASEKPEGILFAKTDTQ